MKKFIVYASAVISIIFWGMSYIWSDELLRQGIPVEYFLFIRILIAGVILLLVNLFLGISIRMQREDSLFFIVLAACEPMIYFFCETYGIKFTESPTYAALIIACTPVVAAMAGVIFFKENISLLNRIGILVCLAGLFMTSVCGERVGKYFILGVVLLLIAVVAEVGHASCTKTLSDRYPPSVIVMYQFLIGSILMFPTFLSNGIVDFNPEVYLSWTVFRPILFLAVLCSSLAFSLWAYAIKQLGVTRACIFLSMIPIVTAVGATILGQDSLGILQWCGIGIACAGLVATQYTKKPAAVKQ